MYEEQIATLIAFFFFLFLFPRLNRDDNFFLNTKKLACVEHKQDYSVGLNTFKVT